MPSVQTARKLLLLPTLCVALLVAALPASALGDVAPNQLGQRMSAGKATATPAGNPPDNAGPPAGAGSGRKVR
jgi:hypothetical protein